MPPPTAEEKERTARLVASLPRREQAELLAQALLREYMHRKGFSRTLQAFDQENPRDERAIASRAVMKRLLNIPVEGRPPSELQVALAAQGSAQPPPSTFMEEVCSHRLTKRRYAQQGRQRRQLQFEKKKMEEEGKATDEQEAALAHALHELQEDPSDSELAELRTRAQVRAEAYREAMYRNEALAALRAELSAETANASAGDRGGSDDDRDDGGAAAEKARRKQKKEKKKGKKSRKLLDRSATEEADADSPTALTAAVGSRWAPPGGLGARGGDEESWATRPSTMGVGEMSLGSSSNSTSSPYGSSSAASAALLSGRPTFVAGDGVTLMGGSGGVRGGVSVGLGSGSSGGILPVSRNEVTEAWRPGAGRTAMAASSASSAAGPMGLLGTGTDAASSASGARGGGGAALGQHAYDPMARPYASALANSGKYTAVSRSSFGSSTDGGRTPSAQSSASPAGSPSILSASTFHSPASATTGPDGMRHGFGFNKSPAPSTGTNASDTSDGARKSRRVTLLVD